MCTSVHYIVIIPLKLKTDLTFAWREEKAINITSSVVMESAV